MNIKFPRSQTINCCPSLSSHGKLHWLLRCTSPSCAFIVFVFLFMVNYIIKSMEGNSSSSPRVSRKGGPPTRKSSRDANDEEGGDLIECSGKYCRSCTAGVIADCVALCCCPCALLNLLTLALVKVPWKIGSRCLGFGKKKRKKVEMKRKFKKNCSNCNEVDDRNQLKGRNLRENFRLEQEMWEFSTVLGEKQNKGKQEEEEEEEEEEMGNFSARFEAEKVWLELYQVGHLGFGRVSFTGT